MKKFNEIVQGLSSDPDYGNSYAYKIIDKYQFTRPEQMKLFLEKVQKPKTPNEEANLITFWESSYAKFNPSVASDAATRYSWRYELINKLGLKTHGNNQGISVITQGGERFGFGGGGFPYS